MMAAAKKVCVVGSGNWGSAIAKIVGANAAKYDRFVTTVNMWVFEETVDGRKLTEIINTDHENVKYLPGHKLPPNVFILKVCDTSRTRQEDASECLLMGANIANEVAEEKFCETTIGCRDKASGPILKELMQTTNFRVTVVEESDVVEICGALKNIVAVGAGFCDGLGFGDNTKAAVIRLGLMEMIAFAKVFCTRGPVSPATFLESCGIADLITTCYGGRNRKIGEAFAKTGKTIEQLENELLHGQKLQGPATAAEVHQILKQKNMMEKFPLFTAVYQICFNGHPVADFIKCLQDHPEHM
ncbi:unnamed protein product, partial [Tetraodon nigroviridis]